MSIIYKANFSLYTKQIGNTTTWTWKDEKKRREAEKEGKETGRRAQVGGWALRGCGTENQRNSHALRICISY